MAACPECGSSMAVRYRRADGRPFLGCTRYPACRGTRGYSGGTRRPTSARGASASPLVRPSPSRPTTTQTSKLPGALVGLLLVAALVGWCGYGSRTVSSSQGGGGTRHPPATSQRLAQQRRRSRRLARRRPSARRPRRQQGPRHLYRLAPPRRCCLYLDRPRSAAMEPIATARIIQGLVRTTAVSRSGIGRRVNKGASKQCLSSNTCGSRSLVRSLAFQ